MLKPAANSLSFLKIHEQGTLRQYDAQIFDLGDMKFTLLRFDEEVVLKQCLQNRSDVVATLVKRFGKYQCHLDK